MLMIWSNRARNRSPDPVVSCFLGRIAPSDTATESRFSIRGNRENEIASFRGLRPESLQSQVTKTARKRLSLSGLEVLHGRLVTWTVRQSRDRALQPGGQAMPLCHSRPTIGRAGI
jgi:hypothetical protein